MELPVVHTVVQPLEVRFAVAIVAGLAATAVMTVAMGLLDEGYVPPYVAASVLFDTSPGAVSKRQADAAHYGAGMLGGVLFELSVLAFEAVRDAVIGVRVVVADVITLTDLIAAVFVVGFLYVFFAYVVFPRFGDHLYADEGTRLVVRRDWLVSATVYGVALLVAVPVLYAFLPTAA